MTREQVTMLCIRDAANSAIPWLSFTFDHPALHDSKMVPCLDLQLWVHHPQHEEQGLGADTLAWSFYEKSTSSSKVMRATSAFTWRCKLVTMSNEVVRRMRNSTRQLTLEARLSIMSTFIDKLRSSGYARSTVDGILTSGLKCYFRKLTIDLEGGPSMNRREDSNAMEMTRRRKKLGASQAWYARRRGGDQSNKDHGWRDACVTTHHQGPQPRDPRVSQGIQGLQGPQAC